MPRYLISFDEGAMSFPEAELPDVAAASLAVVADAEAAGVWVYGAGVGPEPASVVATDGTVSQDPARDAKPHVGGFCVLDVTSREEAEAWAGRIAEACRCAQEVRALLVDPRD